MPSRQPAPGPPRGILRWPTFGLGQLYRAAHAQLEARLAEEGQSLRTYYVLVSLAEHGQLSQQQVCDMTDIDRSDMVRLIDDLEDRKHVRRTRDPDDRRRYRLTLTAQGHKVLRRCDAILAAVTDEVFSALTADQRRTFHRLTLQALGHPPEIADPS